MSAPRRRIPWLTAAALALAGCAAEKKKTEQNTGKAGSLVYSPAERLPARHADDTKGDATAAGPQDEVRPPAGRRVRLHLRRDAMGVSGQAPYPMTGNNLAADRASITGTLERVGRDWMVIRGDRSTYWVARDAVLAVGFVE